MNFTRTQCFVRFSSGWFENFIKFFLVSIIFIIFFSKTSRIRKWTRWNSWFLRRCCYERMRSQVVARGSPSWTLRRSRWTGRRARHVSLKISRLKPVFTWIFTFIAKMELNTSEREPDEHDSESPSQFLNRQISPFSKNRYPVNFNSRKSWSS